MVDIVIKDKVVVDTSVSRFRDGASEHTCIHVRGHRDNRKTGPRVEPGRAETAHIHRLIRVETDVLWDDFD
jgi:hypothetical protein